MQKLKMYPLINPYIWLDTLKVPNIELKYILQSKRNCIYRALCHAKRKRDSQNGELVNKESKF